MTSDQVLFVLGSASGALKLETAVRAAGVPCALIPVPRTIGSQCGVCLRVPAPERARAQAVLVECGAAVTAIHEIEGPPAQPGGAGEETQ